MKLGLGIGLSRGNKVLGGYDADALAYFAALTTAGVTPNDTQKNAFNAFVVSCKSAGVWQKFSALYPFIGGTAAAHAVNAKTPGTYNIGWGGTIVHSANGSQGDGSSGYGNTGFVMTSSESTDLSISVYSRTQQTDRNEIEMGCRYPDANSQTTINFYKSGEAMRYCTHPGITNVGVSNTTSVGHYGFSKNSATDFRVYFNGTNEASYLSSDTQTPSTNSIALLGRHIDLGFDRLSSKQLCFSHIGSSMTASEFSSLSTAVQTLQTALGRQV